MKIMLAENYKAEIGAIQNQQHNLQVELEELPDEDEEWEEDSEEDILENFCTPSAKI